MEYTERELERLRRDALDANPEIRAYDLYKVVLPAYARVRRDSRHYALAQTLSWHAAEVFNDYLTKNRLNPIGDNYGRREDIHDTASRVVQEG